MTSSKKLSLTLLDFTIGYYEQALKLTSLGSNDFSMLSGCILLMTGLEKLLKHALYTTSSWMILPDNKISFEVLRLRNNTNAYKNDKTISCQEAFNRLKELFPQLTYHDSHMKFLIGERDNLVHGFKDVDIVVLEGKFQTKIAEITELICIECLSENPEKVFSQNNTWEKMLEIKNAYTDAVGLDVEQQIKHFRRMFSQGKALGCKNVDFSEDLKIEDLTCPICNNKTDKCGTEWDIDVDHRENILNGAYEVVSAIKCDVCGFTMTDFDEIQAMFKFLSSEVKQEKATYNDFIDMSDEIPM